MKVLSIKQPWASLIVLGAKRFEIRGWKTDYRGPLVIHASSAVVSGPFHEQLLNDGLGDILERAGLASRQAVQALPRSAIIGQVTLADILTGEQLKLVATADDARFTAMPEPDLFYWRLERPRMITPVTGINGKLNLWSLDSKTEAKITGALASSSAGTYKPTKSGKAPADWSEYEPAPMIPSAALAAIVGGEPLSRSEGVKRVWQYIMDKGLRDPSDERTIRPNRVLGRVLGGSPVDLFEIADKLALHLYESNE